MSGMFQRCLALGASGFLLIALASPVFADDEKTNGNKSSDQKIYDTLTKVINDGADLYNKGEQSACYYLYRGALMTLQLQLENHPDLKKKIEEGLAKSEGQARVSTSAFTLRNVLGDIRAQVKPKTAAKKAESKKEDQAEVKKSEDKNKDEEKKKEEEKKKGEEKKKDDKKSDEKKSDDKEKADKESDSKPEDN